MKKSSRMSIAVILIGISLLAVTVMRTNSLPRTMNFGNEGGASEWNMYSDFLLFPRDFTVDIRANNTVDMYILDEAAAKQWNADRTLRAAWTYEDIEQGVFSEHADSRGAYAILVYLPANATTAIKVTLTFSGFEKDLLAASLATIAASIVAIVVSLLIERKNKKLNQKTPKVT